MRKLLLLIIILPFLSCNHNKDSKSVSETEDFSVVLSEKIDSGGMSARPFKILDSIPKELSGVPKLDTMKLQYFTFRSALSPDSISPNKIYAYSGYENGKYFLAYDLNFNKDLSDDQKHYFDRQFGKWKMSINYGKDVKYDTLDYSEYKENKIRNSSLVYKVIPNNGTIRKPDDSMYTDLVIIMQAYDHWWNGVFTLEEKDYKISANPGPLGVSFAVAKQNEDFLTYSDYNFVETKLKDTVQIADSYFSIDSITSDFSELFFKDLKIKEKPHGYTEGDNIKDLKFNDLKYQSTSFSKQISQKEYLLIDFWGTWCAPCLKLNPEVIKLNNDYSDRLSILSFAYDDERGEVFEHIKEYQMKWNHVFLQRDLKGGLEKYPKILKDLKIDAFPTFILLDKDLNILVRGTGVEALEKTKEILTVKQS
ncbi:TlpA disulfide reductase family protein [Aquimarina sp. MMG016]|uniref:TlpA family protein disulfide reductase n=1 Tax=Aquimarina sp. MMG016 TaxID=2822690 RepID=UPI001B3A5B4E|nr:TlpA disulfide reductase family protein [Aquimarina sp. MMG016]MBQ4822667.1 TlpA family protein disulfide reductase [Aquimarina sp. MMG016]